MIYVRDTFQKEPLFLRCAYIPCFLPLLVWPRFGIWEHLTILLFIYRPARDTKQFSRAPPGRHRETWHKRERRERDLYITIVAPAVVSLFAGSRSFGCLAAGNWHLGCRFDAPPICHIPTPSSSQHPDFLRGTPSERTDRSVPAGVPCIETPFYSCTRAQVVAASLRGAPSWLAPLLLCCQS